MPFGKYRGCDLREIREIDEPYLLWVLDHATNASETLREEIRWHLGVGQTSKPTSPPRGNVISREELQGTLAAWYRDLAKKYHPDRGGTNQAMAAINDAAETLKATLKL